ncbi:MAG TPA: hypothetical protein VL967_00845 [Terracidiphilus sp.]|nr:hypothetical protein [Terracidiphilus sp.]
MISGSSGTVSATDFVRKMAGKSQAALLTANDHEQYIVKWMHGPRSTVSVRLEALRNSIYQFLGLPVSNWTTIEIPDELIDAHPEMWIYSPSGMIRPDAGIHFASRLVTAPHGTFYEYLPERLFPSVSNRSDFWGAYAADVWTERFDVRQAVFIPDLGPTSLKAIFIDHGSSYALMTSRDAARLTSCLFSNRNIYLESEMVNDLHDWIEEIRRHGHAAVARALQSLPPDWITNTIAEKAERYVDRIQELKEIIFPSISRFSSAAMKKSRKHCTVRVLLRAGQIL